MKTFLHSRHEAVQEMLKIFNLPENTVAFSFSVRAGEIATITAEMIPPEKEAGEFLNVLKRFELTEIIEEGQIGGR